MTQRKGTTSSILILRNSFVTPRTYYAYSEDYKNPEALVSVVLDRDFLSVDEMRPTLLQGHVRPSKSCAHACES